MKWRTFEYSFLRHVVLTNKDSPYLFANFRNPKKGSGMGVGFT
jgi:hypothetical protein